MIAFGSIVSSQGPGSPNNKRQTLTAARAPARSARLLVPAPHRPPVGRFATASAGKIGMWVFLATDTMGFGGLLLAYAMLRVRATSWPDPATRFDRPLAAVLTFVLLFSGATISAAVVAARTGKTGAARVLLALTALAGLAFVAGQAVEFQALAQARHVGLTADHAAALFYVITGYHGLHVMVGVVVLVAVAIGMKPSAPGGALSLGGVVPAGGVSADGLATSGAVLPTDGVSAEGVTGRDAARSVGFVEVASLYWQFVDLVWIVIFTTLYLLPPVLHG